MKDYSSARPSRLRLFLFIAATVLPVGATPPGSLAAAPDGPGGTLRASTAATSAGTEIRVLRLDAAGVPEWSGDGARIVVPSRAELPSVADDGAGGAFVVWLDRRLGENDRGVRALRLNSTGSVADGWSADGRGICTLPGWASTPVLASDGEGGMWAVWSDRRAEHVNTRGDDVFALRITAGGKTAPGMDLNGVRVSTAPWHQRDPQAIPDAAGGILVAWTDHRGNEPAVFAQHLDASGKVVRGWPANGSRLSAPDGAQSDPAIAPDGAGGAYVGWFESRETAGALMVRRIGPDGVSAKGWPDGGVVLTGSVAAGTRVRLAPAEDGGVTAEWPEDAAQTRFARVRIEASGRFGTATDEAASPLAFRVDRPRPNPTPGGARIEMALPKRGHVTVDLMDVAGRLVRRIENRVFEPGVHTLSWDGSDARGRRVPPAVYFLRVRTPSGSAVHTVVALN